MKILVQISEGMGIEGFQADVHYDTTALSFLQGVPGPAFVSFPLKNVTNFEPGTVRIIAAGLGALLPEGFSIVAELTFEVLEEVGTCHLSFSGIVPNTVGGINAEFYAGEPPPTPTFTPTPTPLIPLVATDDNFKLEFVTRLDDRVTGTGSNLIATTDGFLAVLQDNEGDYLACWNTQESMKRVARIHEIVSIVGMVPSATDSLLLIVDIPDTRQEVYRVSGPFQTAVFQLPRITADLNGDDKVTAQDLFYFQGQWRR